MTRAGPTESLDYGRIRWGDEELQLLTPCSSPTAFTAETLIAHLDWAGVDKAVILQGGFYGDMNAYVAETVARWPDRLLGAGCFDPRTTGADGLHRCLDQYGFDILKFELSVRTGLVGLHPDMRVDGEEFAWIWSEAERRGVLVVLDLGAVGSASYQTDALRSVLDRHPDLRVVIAHLGQPPIARADDPALDALWQEQIMLARRPNVWFDLSSLPAYAAAVEDFPFLSASRWIERAVSLVGAKKLLWGSDIPGVLTVATYPQLQSFVSQHCTFLSDDDRAAILGGNAEAVYFSG